MNTPVLAMNMTVQCADGCVHNDARMYVCDGRKVFLGCDDCEIADVTTIEEATVVVSPVMLLAAVQQCKEAE